jgi:ABC-2 type transport system permease protein
MNVYRFEIRRSFGSFAGWTLGLLASVSVFMQGMYPIYSDSVDDILKMMASFPPEFLAAFGFNKDMFTFGGFYAFTFTYMSLMGVLFTGAVTLGVFAREKRGRCQEFLFAKPMSRTRIFGIKLAAAATLLAVSNLLLLGWVAAVASMAGEQDILGRLLTATGGLFLTELLFMSLMILYAVAARKVRTITGPAMAFAFGGFILTALEGIIDREELRYIAPFKYFDPFHAVLEGGFELPYALTAALLFALAMAGSFLMFIRKDIRI